MSAWTVQIHGVEAATAEVQAAILAGERNGMQRIGARGQQLVMEKWPVGATGLGASSVAWQFNGEREPMQVSIFEGAPADVYAAPVELGARPHFPPPSALLLWVKQKLHEDDEKKALSIAFAIARKIAQRGTPARHMFADANAQLGVEAQGILEKALAEEIAARGLDPRH